MTPKVSIIIITYNQEEFIADTLESAVSQTYKNIEILVCDDGSTDSTPGIIEDFANRYPRIVPRISAENQGITKNCNKGLFAATGEYICFLGGDDLFEQTKVEKQVEYFEEKPDLSICYHDVHIFDHESQQNIGLYSDRHPLRVGGVKDLLIDGCFFCATSVMIRKDRMPKNGFNELISRASDWLFWCEVALQNPKAHDCVGYCDGVLAKYRRHANNVTNRVDERALKEAICTLDILAASYPSLNDTIRKSKCTRLLTYCAKYLLNGQFCQSFRALIKALRVGGIQTFGTLFGLSKSYIGFKSN